MYLAKNLAIPAAIIIFSTMTTQASAGISVEQVIDPNVPPGFVANEIVWDGGGTEDWTSASVLINASGTAFQHAFGGDTTSGSALWVPFPDLEFDTAVHIVDDGSAGCCSNAGGPLSLDLPEISVSWFNTDATNTGRVRIGMFTLSDDAQGTWLLTSAGETINGTVVNGAMVPEPASLLLLFSTIPALIRRR